MYAHVQELKRLQEDNEGQGNEAGVHVVEEIDTEKLTEQYAAQVSYDYNQAFAPFSCEGF